MTPKPQPTLTSISKKSKIRVHCLTLVGLRREFAPLHRINPLRLGYIMQRVDGIFGKNS